MAVLLRQLKPKQKDTQTHSARQEVGIEPMAGGSTRTSWGSELPSYAYRGLHSPQHILLQEVWGDVRVV